MTKTDLNWAANRIEAQAHEWRCTRKEEFAAPEKKSVHCRPSTSRAVQADRVLVLQLAWRGRSTVLLAALSIHRHHHATIAPLSIYHPATILNRTPTHTRIPIHLHARAVLGSFQ
eukprot:TRINITY_DN9161_c0_g1_i1.p1 TRINITY_DN9161_c0_g1~~TRINITY_DN9161_c0_g1_i1.p1  ORF type:complete len:115 (-),score=10.55 TRINITY_DN9161_c0_g1_i1:186-530(-)